MWFEQLTGFKEESPEQVRHHLHLEGWRLTSRVNGRVMACGQLEISTLAELRRRAAMVALAEGQLSLREVVADVQQLHTDPVNANALFQVASQFNLLEMVSPDVTPEQGIGIYEHDRTQGPACAIAAGAGTIYRNYFVEVNGQVGQSATNQVDCLQDLGAALGNTDERLWRMQNGYALATKEGLAEISAQLGAMSEAERDSLRERLRVGLQWQSEVTLPGAAHTVSQIYCSALPVAYSAYGTEQWEPFARLVLEAAYEATFCAAIINAHRYDNRTLYLTLLGGGAFGNKSSWILAALRRAVRRYRQHELDVALVSYGASNRAVQQFISQL